MAKQSEKLAVFLLSLQTSRSARTRLHRDPEAVMKSFGLNETTIQALYKKNYKKLWQILIGAGVRKGQAIHDEIMTATGVRERHRRRK